MTVGMGDIKALAPAFATFLFGMFVLVAPFLKPFRASSDRTGALLTTFIGLGAAALLNHVVAGWLPLGVLFDGMVRVDAYSVFLNDVVLLAAAGMLLIGHDHLERIEVRVPEYNALVLFAVFGMMLLNVANDLMLVFLAIEVMSIAVYVLVAINRGEMRAVEGAFKYFVLGAFSSAILLYGIAFVFGATHSTRLDDLALWFANHSLSGSPIMAVGLAMLFVGLAFKVAAAPFHMWSPDAYEGAPTPVTAFMATGVKVASFAAFGRIVLTVLAEDPSTWANALWAITALSILVGNVGALVQTDLKRMLAYSSVGHAGYMLMALVAAPPPGDTSGRAGALLFYLLAYTIMTVAAFAVLSLIARDGREDTRIERLRGLSYTHPWIAIGLTFALLSLAGIPPTMGFVGKFYLFLAAVDGGYPGLAVIGALGGAIGVYYYLRPIALMYMYEVEDELRPSLNRPAAVALWLSVALLAFFGVLPGPVMEWCRASVLSLAM